MQEYPIEFFCYENDEPIEVQLEPEAIIFKASPNSSLKFVAKSATGFAWTLRLEHATKGIQLFPDSQTDYDIDIYLNGVLLNNWYI